MINFAANVQLAQVLERSLASRFFEDSQHPCRPAGTTQSTTANVTT